MAANDSHSVEDWEDDVVAELDEESGTLSESSLTAHMALDLEPEAFHNAATGSLESLIQLCESSPSSVTAFDKSGHSLLRYALKELHVENARVLLERGSDASSMEPVSFTNPNAEIRVSHLGFLISQCTVIFFNPRPTPGPQTRRNIMELQSMLLQHGADLSQVGSGCIKSQDVLFYGGICGGGLQVLLPLYLSNSPHINLEAVDTVTGYTRLLSVCHSTFDPYGDKVNAVRLLIRKGANARVCCETFGNSALHLALLSARDEVCHFDGKTWTCDSEQLRFVLVSLLRGHAPIDTCNRAGLTPADFAIGLNCIESWNNAMEDCGLFDHLIDNTSDVCMFRQDLSKQRIFDRFWEDYHHFNRWCCPPDSCTGRGPRLPASRQANLFFDSDEQCPWWEEYNDQWLPYWTWDVKKSDWGDL